MENLDFKNTKLPEGWKSEVDPKSGRTYYHRVEIQPYAYYIDHVSKKTRWHHPLTCIDKKKTILPEGWESRVDPESGRTYHTCQRL